MHVWYYTYAISDDTLVQVWVHSWNTLWVAFTLNPLEVVNMNDNHVLHTATTFHPLPWEWSIKVSGCHSLNARFLKPRQMSWSQWGNCSCWLVATICHCPRDQFEEQWRLLDTVGAKLSLKKMRGRRKISMSIWMRLWVMEAVMASLHCMWIQLRPIFDVNPLKHVGWSYGNQNLWALSGKYTASELFERGTEEYVLKQARKARRCDSCLQIWKYRVVF